MFGRLRQLNWKVLVLYIIPIFYLYAQILRDYLNLMNTGTMGSRSLPLIALTVIGFFLAKKTTLNKVDKAAVLFVLYMTVVAFVGGTENLFIYVSCLLIWVFVLYSGNRLKISRQDLTAIGYIGGVLCSLTSFYYITLSKMDVYSLFSHDSAVAGYNSIYYILIALPFIFLIPNKLYVALFSILPIIAFWYSSKSTCLITTGISLVYYFYSSLKTLSPTKKISFSVLVLGGISCYALVYGWGDFFSDIIEDIDSGGNGRSDIALQVISLFFNDCSVLEMIFGNGVNAVTRQIHIGAHNDFIETLYCFGFIGLILYLNFIYQLFSQIKMVKQDVIIRKAYVISLIVFLCASFASKLLGTQMLMILPALFWGLTTKIEIYGNSTHNSID